MRPKSFFINGGAGRVICSIPALEKYKEDHPEEDFVIVCEGGMEFYRGHPTLHAHAYESWHKDLFSEKIKHTDCVTPEPYRVWEYYNQKCNLSQAFDIIINNKGIRELPRPTIYRSTHEKINGKLVVAEVRQKTNKKKTVLFQPFGRSVSVQGNLIFDGSGRSFEWNNAVSLVKRLQKKYSVIWMSELPIDPQAEGLKDTICIPNPQQLDLRAWAGVIGEVDLVLGCDSVAQHIAYALETPAVVVAGATFPENISYPDYEKFDVLDMGEGKRVYDPIRISMDDKTARVNDAIMAMNDKVEEVIIKSIDKLMNKYYRKPDVEVLLPDSMCGPQGCPPENPEKPKQTMSLKDLPKLETKKDIFSDLITKEEPKPAGFLNSKK